MHIQQNISSRSAISFRKIIACLYLMLLIFPAICTAENGLFKTQDAPTTFNREVIDYFLSSGQKGVLISFLGDPAFKSNKLQRNFYVDAGAFSAKVLIHSEVEQNLEYTLYCLIDYNQVAFSVAGNISKSHQVNLSTGVEQILEIRLPEISSGSHDVLFLLKRNAIGNEIINDKTDFRLFTWRSIVNVGDDHRFQENHFEKISKTKNINNSRQGFTIAAKSKGCKLNCPLSAEATFAIDQSNGLKSAKFGTILFAGNDQLLIGQDGKNMARYFEGNFAKKNRFDISTNILKTSKDIWGFVVINPFIQLEAPGEMLVRVPNEIFLSNSIKLK